MKSVFRRSSLGSASARHAARIGFAIVIATAAFFVAPLSAQATTKGLNQIVTPDVQPEGQLSISGQMEDPNIGNRKELQLELGLTKNFEIAVFQGTSPAEQIANVELGLYAKGPYLLSTGFLNWSTKGTAPQPFLEGGYYKGNTKLSVGAIDVVSEGMGVGGSITNSHETQAILGYAYQTDPRTLLQVDYQAGSGNFATAGFTYSITPALNFNPAVYITNSTPRHYYGYAVLTWNVQLFK